MILDHCHKASCVQIIESLRAKVAELEAKLAKYQNLEPVAWVITTENDMPRCGKSNYTSESITGTKK